MVAIDFEYAGEFLSDWGCMICDTDHPNGFQTINSDSQRTFDTISQFTGKKFVLTTSYYNDHIEITFQICKFICPDGVTAFKEPEVRAMKRWLNRPDFHHFKLIQPEWPCICMNGSFNVSNIEYEGRIVALELTFISDRPFALHEPIKKDFEITTDEKTYSFIDISDEIGYIYPYIQITCQSAGNMTIINSQEPDRETLINNVVKDEILTFEPKLIISSSIPTHKIQNDFNFIFPRISNSYESRINSITFSLPCKVSFTYQPYVKAVQ